MEQSHTYQYSDSERSVSLAVKVSAGADNSRPGFVWFGGFKSDMDGTKAEAMVQHAAAMGCASLRFDYSGHGISGGEFTDGTISKWVAETVAVFREFTSGPQVILGSSMGGWIALRVVEELEKLGESNRIAGLLLIAPAPDFTNELMEKEFTREQRELLETQGYVEEHSEYSDEPNIITRDLIEDGRNNSVLSGNLIVNAPVRILQGMKDPDVPYEHAMKLVSCLAHDNVSITLVKDGDHRLSTDANIDLLRRTMTELAE